MPKRTIAKFSIFVILAALVCSLFSACGNTTATDRNGAAFDQTESRYEAPRVVGNLESAELKESSGLAASKCQADVLWTHNDSGDEALIYAVSTTGKHLGVWKVKGATNVDWEDIAAYKNEAGECFVYIGEIGDNERKREYRLVYRVKEPQINDDAKNSGGKKPLETENVEVLKFIYPDAKHDSEALLVHPVSGDIYIVTKRFDGPAGIYKLNPDFGGVTASKAKKIGELSLPAVPNGFVTGGDISPDGRRLVVCDYFAGYEITLPEKSTDFDDIWKQKPERFDIGERKIGEAIAYSSDGNAVYATSEKVNAPLIKTGRKKTEGKK
ncbi:MAG: hypothetical protein ACT4O9_02805 [Blastocatellia bacterium]